MSLHMYSTGRTLVIHKKNWETDTLIMSRLFSFLSSNYIAISMCYDKVWTSEVRYIFILCNIDIDINVNIYVQYAQKATPYRICAIF